jgi:hypothetical protein
MTTPPRTIQELEALNLGDLPVLEVVARETVPYRIDRQWGPFDELGLRAIDDLWFPESSKERALVFSASEIALPDGFESIAIPAPIDDRHQSEEPSRRGIGASVRRFRGSAWC